jgi:CBS domain-containing protein
LLEKHYSGAPVVDGAMKLVGVLSKKDCLRAALNASYFQEWGGSVADYMSADVETLDADLDLVQAAERFLKNNYRRFPVMREGRLIGQISRADLLRAIAEHWNADRNG